MSVLKFPNKTVLVMPICTNCKRVLQEGEEWLGRFKDGVLQEVSCLVCPPKEAE